MYSKTLIIALTFVASSLAAPIATSDSAIVERATESTDGSMSTMGFGIHTRNSSASSENSSEDVSVLVKDTMEDEASIKKRTGYGIISGGNDEA